MQPGPELDRAVAEICGIDGRIVPPPFGGNQFFTGEDSVAMGCATWKMGKQFSPSTDANDALLAAERFNLWAGHSFVLGQAADGSYVALKWLAPMIEDIRGTTAAHAISLAILSLRQPAVVRNPAEPQ